jgi:hypothetical protein
LGNNKADNSNELVENLLFSSQKLDFIMSLKILFTNFHQDIFPEKCGALNSEHGECHHVISAKEKTISGQVEFTDVGRLLLVSNKKFSWTCV